MTERYYDRRAEEYEEVYRRHDPVRQKEQTAIAQAMREALRGRRVLEVACGTGFWTAIAARVCEHVVAIDISPEMLAVARKKGLPADRVEFYEGDVYSLESVLGTFSGGLANFWFSHVPKARINQFLSGFHQRLGIGAVVFMADNVYLPGIGGEVVRRPDTEDSFKVRELSDGSRHEVLKNYYDAEDLRDILSPLVRDLQVHIGRCFWWVRYVVEQASPKGPPEK